MFECIFFFSIGCFHSQGVSRLLDAHCFLVFVAVRPDVVFLEHKLADLDVNPEVLQKVHELGLTEKEFIRQLQTSSDRDLMTRLRLKQLEIIALRGIFRPK